MSEQQCKAAFCIGNCREAMVLPSLREAADVLVNLIAGGSLSEDQYGKIIEVATRYEDEVARRKRIDATVRDELKAIIGIP